MVAQADSVSKAISRARALLATYDVTTMGASAEAMELAHALREVARVLSTSNPGGSGEVDRRDSDPSADAAGTSVDSEDDDDDEVADGDVVSVIARFDLLIADSAALMRSASASLDPPDGDSGGGDDYGESVIEALDAFSSHHGAPWWIIDGVEVLGGGIVYVKVREDSDVAGEHDGIEDVLPPEGEVVFFEGFTAV